MQSQASVPLLSLLINPKCAVTFYLAAWLEGPAAGRWAMRGETGALCWVNTWIFEACWCSLKHLLLGTCLSSSTWILPGMVEQGEVGKWEKGMQSDRLPLLLMGAGVCIKEQNPGNFFRAKPPSKGWGTVCGFQHRPQWLWVSCGRDGRRWEGPCPVHSPSSPGSLLLFSLVVAVSREVGRLGKETAPVPPCPPPHYPAVLHCNKLNHSTSLFHIWGDL